MIRGPAFDEYRKTKSKDWIPAFAGMTNPKPGGESSRALPVAAVPKWAWEMTIRPLFEGKQRVISDVRFTAGFLPATCRRRALYEVFSS